MLNLIQTIFQILAMILVYLTIEQYCHNFKTLWKEIINHFLFQYIVLFINIKMFILIEPIFEKDKFIKKN